jgi:hypothetical protein
VTNSVPCKAAAGSLHTTTKNYGFAVVLLLYFCCTATVVMAPPPLPLLLLSLTLLHS